MFFFFSSRRRHTRCSRDWSSDVCSSDLGQIFGVKRVWPARTYEQNLGEPFTITPELHNISLRCGRAFGIDLYGLDIIENNGKPYVVDVSSFPGFKGVPDAALRLADYIYSAGQRVLNGEPLLPSQEKEVEA